MGLQDFWGLQGLGFAGFMASGFRGLWPPGLPWRPEEGGGGGGPKKLQNNKQWSPPKSGICIFLDPPPGPLGGWLAHPSKVYIVLFCTIFHKDI